jgi:viroplasmin and RNaseH domain-containing protein
MPKAPKSKKKGNKFYAVRVGRTTGVFQTWDECEMQVCQQEIPDDI